MESVLLAFLLGIGGIGIIGAVLLFLYIMIGLLLVFIDKITNERYKLVKKHIRSEDIKIRKAL